MAPAWLHELALLFLALTALSVAVIVTDSVLGHHHRMRIMNVVWPVTALYFGPFGLWLYWKIGRPAAEAEQQERHPRRAA